MLFQNAKYRNKINEKSLLMKKVALDVTSVQISHHRHSK
jgi:hypothetical protein